MRPRTYKFTAVVMLLALAAFLFPAIQARQVVQAAAPERLVLAFYYAWFDENSWNANRVGDVPAQAYVSRDRGAIDRQIDQARSAGIDAFVVSWYGPQVQNNQTETNFAALLDEAGKRNFRATVDFETRSPFYSSQGDIVNALRTLIQIHATKPAFLRSGGKPVIFFWSIQNVFRNSGQPAVDAWAAIRNQVDPNHTTVWIAEGTDISYQSVFDGHHLYNITWNPPTDPEISLGNWGQRVRNFAAQAGSPRIWVATVMPGYNDLHTGRGNAFALDRGDGSYYAHTWQAAIHSQPDWVIITSWNEYPEGTYIEPSRAYGNTYLNLTRQWAAQFKSGARVAAVADAALQPSFTPTQAHSAIPTQTLNAIPTRTLNPTPVPVPVETATATPAPLPSDGPILAHLIYRNRCGIYANRVDFDCD